MEDNNNIEEQNKKKNLKITHKSLEELEFHPDQLIKDFRFEIVERLNDDELIPSWAIIHSLEDEKNELLDIEKKKLKSSTDELAKENAYIKKDIDNIVLNNKTYSKSLNKTKLNYDNLVQKTYRKKSIVLCIFTFGIYGYLTSEKHKKKLQDSIYKIRQKLSFYENTLNNNRDEIKALENKIIENNEKSDSLTKNYYIECNKITEKYMNLISNVKVLD